MPGLGEPFFLGGHCSECGSVRLWRQVSLQGEVEKVEIDIGPARGLLCANHPEGDLTLGVYAIPGTTPVRGYGVWRLRTYWNDGDETGDWLFSSRKAALEQLLEYVRAWWAQDFGERPMPADPEEAIREYFAENQAESYSLAALRVRFEPQPIDEAFKTQMAGVHLGQADAGESVDEEENP